MHRQKCIGIHKYFNKLKWKIKVKIKKESETKKESFTYFVKHRCIKKTINTWRLQNFNVQFWAVFYRSWGPIIAPVHRESRCAQSGSWIPPILQCWCRSLAVYPLLQLSLTRHFSHICLPCTFIGPCDLLATNCYGINSQLPLVVSIQTYTSPGTQQLYSPSPQSGEFILSLGPLRERSTISLRTTHL